MAVDWNSIITVATGGTIGVLGSVLTQIVQGRRESRKVLDERAAGAAVQVRDTLNDLYLSLMRHWDEDERTNQASLYDYLETEKFRARQVKLAGETLLLRARDVRGRMEFVSKALGWSPTIGSRVKVTDFRIATDLCNYGREVIGCYLRQEKMVREPDNIQLYHEIYDLLVLEQKSDLNRLARSLDNPCTYAA